MSGAQKDQSLGQVIAEAKPILAAIPEQLDAAKKALNEFVTSLPSGTDAYTQANALRIAINSGIVQADQAVGAIEKLLHQFAFPLGVVGGMKLQGSGQLIEAGTNTYRGLQTTLTEVQKAINTIIPAVQGIILIASFALAVFPQLGIWAPVGGLSLAKIVGILGTYLNVKNSNYSDAPRAQLVALPAKQ